MTLNKRTLMCLTMGLAFLARAGIAGEPAERPPRQPQPPALEVGVPVIDVHDHLHGLVQVRRGGQNRCDDAAKAALVAMDAANVRAMIIMPPPFADGHPACYESDSLFAAANAHSGRFFCLAGGGTLNPMISRAVKEGKVTEEMRREFRATAEGLLRQGAIGFGEFAVEHFSLGEGHNHQSAAADHPLLLLLADIAAEHGVPIDIHMEAVVREKALPSHLQSPPNPKTLTPNVEAFERLLAHDRGATIIWSHIGWDNTGDRTTELTRQLLKKHPNLFMSFKISPRDSLPATRPVEEGEGLKEEWLALIREFPDRFLVGSDQFFAPAGVKSAGPPSFEPTLHFFTLLPEDVARKVGYENALRLFKLKDKVTPSNTPGE